MTWERLRSLASFRAESGCAISLYLDLEPQVAPTPVDVSKRARSLIDAAARGADAAEQDLGHDARVALRADLDRIRAYVEDDFERDGAHGFALFSASLDDLWQPLKLAAPVPDAVKVKSDLYLTPLVPLVESGEGAIVAQVGRERGDVYRLQGDQLVAIADRSEEQLRRHDQGGWSQANYQRHVDDHAHAHLRAVADELDRRLRAGGVPALVIACSDDIRGMLAPLLSTAVSAALGGWLHAEAHATPAELVPGAMRVLAERREQREQSTLERWRQDVGRGVRAAAGWAETLEAASDARVDVLLYREGVNRPAWLCRTCGRTQATGGACPVDGVELEENADGLDLAVHQTLVHGGTAFAVTSRADLDAAGGIGALLRY